MNADSCTSNIFHAYVVVVRQPLAARNTHAGAAAPARSPNTSDRVHCGRSPEVRSRNASTRADLGLPQRSSATYAPRLRSNSTQRAGSTRAAASALTRSPRPRPPPRATRPIGMPLPRERSRQHERKAVRPRGVSACFRAGGWYPSACRERLRRPPPQEANPYSTPQEVHRDADAVRSVPRV